MEWVIFIAGLIVWYLVVTGRLNDLIDAWYKFKHKTPYLHKCKAKHYKYGLEEMIDPETGEKCFFEFADCEWCGRDIYIKLPWYKALNCSILNKNLPDWKFATPELLKARYKALNSKPENYKADIIAPNNKDKEF